MTWAMPVDERTERDVLAGLACERATACGLYPMLNADVFVAHRLHPYIFGTLRRLHLAGAGKLTLDADDGPQATARRIVNIAGFVPAFDQAYPNVGAGPALALLRDAIADCCVLWPHYVRQALRLRDRRRLLTIIQERLERRDYASLSDLHRLDELGNRIAAETDLGGLAAELEHFGLDLEPVPA